MQYTETLPFIAERDATGEVAEVFEDIRATLKLPVVNLIWRHFATIDGGLGFAWDTLRPLYVSGAAERAGAYLVAGLDLPHLEPVPEAVLRGAGVSDEERPVLFSIMDSYNRGNALNICALSTLLVEPAGEPREESNVAPLPHPAMAVPGVPDLSELTPELRELIWTLNALGQPPGESVLATMYKHVALWPGFLALSHTMLAPLHRDGRLASLVRESAEAARTEAARLVDLRAAPRKDDAAEAVREAARHFVDRVIGRMIPILLMLDRAMPRGRSSDGGRMDRSF